MTKGTFYRKVSQSIFDHNLEPTTGWVLMAIQMNINPYTNQWQVSYDDIAQIVSVSRRTVIRHIKVLVEKGLIAINAMGKGYDREANMYSLCGDLRDTTVVTRVTPESNSLVSPVSPIKSLKENNLKEDDEDSNLSHFEREGFDKTTERQDAQLPTPSETRMVELGIFPSLANRLKYLSLELIERWVTYLTEHKSPDDFASYLAHVLKNGDPVPIVDANINKPEYTVGKYADVVKGDIDEPDDETQESEQCEACGSWFCHGCEADTEGEVQDNLPAPLPDKAHEPTEQAQYAWSAAYNQLELQLDRASFDTWLRPAVLLGIHDDGRYVVQVHTRHAQEMLQNRLYRNVKRVLSDIAGSASDILFVTQKAQESPHGFRRFA